MDRIFVLLLAILAYVPSMAQDEGDPMFATTYRHVPKTFRYRVSLNDKAGTSYSLKHPEKFLSEKALERRKRYRLKVDEYDLPVSSAYTQKLQKMGLHICNMSKWNNTVVVETADTMQMQVVRRLPFVRSVRRVWESPDSLPIIPERGPRQAQVTNKRDTTLTSYYGYGQQQVTMLGVDKLHEKGYRGQGIVIAVIDGGFYNADLMKGFSQQHLLGTRNFVRPQKCVFEELEHGMMVLSCIAANEPHYLVGTAPEVSYYLLQSEDGESEQLVEEDNWCAALEYADSVGCDIVTSSLGYYQFDHKDQDHFYRELDGYTALNSRSASLAASRGIILLNSAGNSGMSAWKKIGFPADGRDMLAVGAVQSDSLNTRFSSIGNSADGRIKPDVMAMGQASAVYETDGTVTNTNGTSFSCPTMAGAVACLVQAYPNRRPTDIIKALQQSANNADHPDNIFGYGIPNVMKAFNLLK